MAIGTLQAKSKNGASGSYTRLEYVPTSEIDAYLRIVDDSGFFGGVLNLKSFGQWRTMPIVRGSNRSWSLDEKQGKSGTIHTTRATGTLMGGGEPSDMRVLRDMKEAKHLFRLTLTDGRVLLFADYEFPATFSFKVDGKEQKNELRRVSFTFEAQSPNEICQL